MKYWKLDQSERDGLNKAVLLLRYHVEAPKAMSLKYCSYRSIAKLLGLSYGTVQHLCRKALRRVKRVKCAQQVY